jgi:adenosylhomocysteine nucleosidase
MNKIVIQTALLLEQEAIVSKLTNIKIDKHPTTGTEYNVGYYNTGSKRLEIIVGRTNQTNINAAVETERIIQHFNPTHLFFLGVAGGLKDVAVGDIVIGSNVIGYERGKSEIEFLPRSQFGFSSYSLEQSVSTFATTKEWKQLAENLTDPKFHSEVKVFVGTIVSGEKVIGSKESELYKFIRKNFSQALAVEMEGLGFLEACRPYPLIKSLLVRGISDLVDKKEDSDAAGSQLYASKVATEFLLSYINYLSNEFDPIPNSAREKLMEIAPKLYPMGLRDQEIWTRAGGDLSLVNINTTGKSQWIRALLLVENGGGGDINFNSLISAMKQDYKNNESLHQL